MKTRFNIKLIFFFLVFLPGLVGYAQEDLPVACGGETVRYGVVGDNGNSVFFWEITGGTIIENYNDSVDVQWTSTDGIRTITVTETNLYGCEGEPYSQQLVVSSPYIDLGSDAEICADETYEFIASGDEVSSYLWQDGSNGETFIASEEGDYWVRVTDEYGCVSSDTAGLIVHPLPEVDLGPDTTLNADDQSVTFDVSEFGTFYNWFDGSNASTYTAYAQLETQEIWVEVTNDYGCIGADTVYVEFGEFTIPTAFTPNNDGHNDVWKIDFLFNFSEVTVDIYNRWGELVFHSDGYSSDKYWDGTNQNGRKLPMDAYYYVIDLHNGEQPKVGTVTLIR
ncbi:MAG: gliding motility-associated C-terminal domain-containing protein [Bacteroidales bacterium]